MLVSGVLDVGWYDGGENIDWIESMPCVKSKGRGNLTLTKFSEKNVAIDP